MREEKGRGVQEKEEQVRVEQVAEHRAGGVSDISEVSIKSEVKL